MANYICTYTGIKIDPLNPDPDLINVEDIAHSLSNVCRYTGQCLFNYSVAQHSLLITDFCSPQNKLICLLHDASESYLSDLASPLKSLPEFDFYRKIEKNIQTIIYKKFCGVEVEPEEVKLLDTRIRHNEFRDLMINSENHYNHLEPLNMDKIQPWSFEFTKEKFLKTFKELY